MRQAVGRLLSRAEVPERAERHVLEALGVQGEPADHVRLRHHPGYPPGAVKERHAVHEPHRRLGLGEVRLGLSRRLLRLPVGVEEAALEEEHEVVLGGGLGEERAVAAAAAGARGGVLLEPGDHLVDRAARKRGPKGRSVWGAVELGGEMRGPGARLVFVPRGARLVSTRLAKLSSSATSSSTSGVLGESGRGEAGEPSVLAVGARSSADKDAPRALGAGARAAVLRRNVLPLCCCEASAASRGLAGPPWPTHPSKCFGSMSETKLSRRSLTSTMPMISMGGSVLA